MNLVVITAALSSANTNLYLTTRTLFSLSRDGYVSETLGRLGKKAFHTLPCLRLPAEWWLLSCSPSLLPDELLAALRCRGRRHVLRMDRYPARPSCLSRALGQARLALLPIRLPFSPYSQIAALIALAAITISTFYVDGLQYTVPGFIPFLLVTTVFYRVLKRSKSA